MTIAFPANFHVGTMEVGFFLLTRNFFFDRLFLCFKCPEMHVEFLRIERIEFRGIARLCRIVSASKKDRFFGIEKVRNGCRLCRGGIQNSKRKREKG